MHGRFFSSAIVHKDDIILEFEDQFAFQIVYRFRMDAPSPPPTSLIYAGEDNLSAREMSRKSLCNMLRVFTLTKAQGALHLFVGPAFMVQLQRAALENFGQLPVELVQIVKFDAGCPPSSEYACVFCFKVDLKRQIVFYRLTNFRLERNIEIKNFPRYYPATFNLALLGGPYQLNSPLLEMACKNTVHSIQRS